jgi:hypothetical protein
VCQGPAWVRVFPCLSATRRTRHCDARQYRQYSNDQLSISCDLRARGNGMSDSVCQLNHTRFSLTAISRLANSRHISSLSDCYFSRFSRLVSSRSNFANVSTFSTPFN